MDDDDQLRHLLKRVLVQAGHEVQLAEDGAKGLLLFERSNPDLVITDIVMPKTEGVGTIFEIRRSNQQVPIIAISGNGSALAGDYLHVAKKLGADRTLGKPFRPTELLAVVDELLGVVQA